LPSVSLLNDQFSHDFQYVLALTRYEFIDMQMCVTCVTCVTHFFNALIIKAFFG